MSAPATEHVITDADTARARSIKGMHWTPDGRPHGRACNSCAFNGTCEENEWATSYLDQLTAQTAAGRPAS